MVHTAAAHIRQRDQRVSNLKTEKDKREEGSGKSKLLALKVCLQFDASFVLLITRQLQQTPRRSLTEKLNYISGP